MSRADLAALWPRAPAPCAGAAALLSPQAAWQLLAVLLLWPWQPSGSYEQGPQGLAPSLVGGRWFLLFPHARCSVAPSPSLGRLSGCGAGLGARGVDRKRTERSPPARPGATRCPLPGAVAVQAKPPGHGSTPRRRARRVPGLWACPCGCLSAPPPPPALARAQALPCGVAHPAPCARGRPHRGTRQRSGLQCRLACTPRLGKVGLCTAACSPAGRAHHPMQASWL